MTVTSGRMLHVPTAAIILHHTIHAQPRDGILEGSSAVLSVSFLH